MMDNSRVCYNDNIMGDNSHSGDESGTTRTTKSGSSSSSSSRRKINRLDQLEPNHSHGSLLSTMERFVKTVDDMNETILVPCRLMDLKFDEQASSGLVGGDVSGGDHAKRLMQDLNGVDLFQFYSMLNSVKNDLMWGNKQSTTKSTPTENNNCNNSHSTPLATAQPPQSQPTTTEVKGHARRPSTVSTTSSTSASDTEFSELNEDSGVEAEEEYVQHMADSFHHHLNGLQQCLRDLTIAADYVTTRYNNDLGGNNIY